MPALREKSGIVYVAPPENYVSDEEPKALVFTTEVEKAALNSSYEAIHG